VLRLSKAFRPLKPGKAIDRGKGGSRLDRKEKEQAVAELHERLKSVTLAVLAGYSGMNVGKITALRNELRKTGTELRVVKNTLLGIAAQGTDFAGLKDQLKGPLSLSMIGAEVVSPTKVLIDYAKKNPELDIKFAWMNGKLLTRQQLDILSELPSRDVLLAQLLSLFVAAQTQFVTVLSAVPRSFVQVLEAYRQKKEEANQ
jgi:large subunit ribosomal protein L10